MGCIRSFAMATSAGPGWAMPPTYEMAMQLRQRNRPTSGAAAAAKEAPRAPPDVARASRYIGWEEAILTLLLFGSLGLAWIHHEQQLLAYLSLSLLACLVLWVTNTILHLEWLLLEQSVLLVHLAMHTVFASSYGSPRDRTAVTLLSCVAPVASVYLHVAATKVTVLVGVAATLGISVAILSLGSLEWPHFGSLGAGVVLSALRLFDVYHRKRRAAATAPLLAAVTPLVATNGRYSM